MTSSDSETGRADTKHTTPLLSLTPDERRAVLLQHYTNLRIYFVIIATLSVFVGFVSGYAVATYY